MTTYHALDAIAHASRLHQAGLDHELQRYIQQLSEQGFDEIMPWLKQLSLRAAQYDKSSLPDSVYQRCLGWQAYFEGRYIAAYEHFQSSIRLEAWQQCAYDAALGMAKVYTRSGHWQSAQAWAMYYLSVARTMRDDFGLTKGYGSLAEIYLRGNQPQAALACFQIANQLMPVGQGQLDKQYNFIASALLRNGEWLRAETLLRNSIKISTDKLIHDADDMSAKISYLHSQSRLNYLYLERGQAIAPTEQLTSLLAQLTSPALHVPTGFVLSAYAIQAIQSKQYDSARDYLISAQGAFGATAAMERQWVQRLLDGLSGNLQSEFSVEPICQALMDIQPIDAPSIDTVVDRTWAGITLNNQGYEPLIDGQDSIETLTAMWRLFFI